MAFFGLDMELTPDPWNPEFDRTVALLRAIGENTDFEIIETRTKKIDGLVALEGLVVEVECDGVPPCNRFGIQYRERLLILVPADEKSLVSVSALREDFPTLPHMNDSPVGTPLSLCLYYEPASAVLRTWTPQKFLRRIQWWLGESARETIHPADQPVEQLFFATPYEIVLPWNFLSEIQADGSACRVSRREDRSNGGATFILEVCKNSPAADGRSIVPVIVRTQSVVHGQVERLPATLHELSSMLERRGVDVVAEIRNSLMEEASAEGLIEGKNSRPVLLLLLTPIARVAGGQAERTQIKAFLLGTDYLQLGVKVSAYFRSPDSGRYFADRLKSIDDSEAATWRSETLVAIDVLRINDAEEARRQAGLREAGPKGVLVGAGALGSALLNLWSRSGWGEWAVVDKDHVKPHNLARHTAIQCQVGKSKVQAVSDLNGWIAGGATTVQAIDADALSFDRAVTSALGGAQLVVDASADLSFPRAVSGQNDIGRHVSVFITPDGNGAVLLAEDESRSIRLLALEGQYYRQVINADWGKRHLTGHLGTYYSGASCRDISYALPYSRVLVHAACLSEQIQRISKDSGASISIWQRDPETGDTKAYRAETFSVRQIPFGHLSVVIDRGLEQKLFSLRSQKLPEETGGILLGYFDLSLKVLVLVDVCPAPSDSDTTRVTFRRGVKGVPERVLEVGELTAGIVGYVGEWHSHPPGCPAELSADDIFQLAGLALGMAEDGLPAVSLIVNDNDIRIFEAEVA